VEQKPKRALEAKKNYFGLRVIIIILLAEAGAKK